MSWNDNTLSWIPEYELVQVETESNDVFSLLKAKRFGRLNDLRRNLTYIHLSGRLANVVYSMDTTNTDFYAYQYKPVLTFLESPSNGILIADEVGLGKTIEAGLIWTELRARYDARRLLIVCPAMLREKWCDELSKRFGVEGIPLSASELLKELRRNKFDIPDGKGFVCSLQGLRPTKDWQNSAKKGGDAELARYLESLAEKEPVIDLLVIDEAHYLRNPETQSATLGHLLREVSEHVVLLSATPINNKGSDLFQLLRLVDPDSFAVADVFPQVLAANEPLIKARNLALDPNAEGVAIQQHLHTAAGHALFTGNRQLAGLLERNLDADYLAEKANRVDLANRIERINLLRHTVNRTRKVEVQELRVHRQSFSEFVALDPAGPEWDFYQRVTDAIRGYAFSQGINDGFLLSPPQRQISSCMYAAARSWMDKTGIADLDTLRYEDQGADDKAPVDIAPLIEHIAHTVLPYVNTSLLRTLDSKYRSFSTVIYAYFKDHPNEKLIVFSYFKGTLRYLAERLEEDGIRIMLLHGDIKETKQDVINRFRDDSAIRILLASEVASEGVDLQFCRGLINYDLPWNPMKIEQRIGRIDRIGQEADKIFIWNLGYANTIDERIYQRLLIKLDIFERALGGMEAILGELISQLTSELLSQPLTAEQEQQRIDKTYLAVENIRRQQEELEANAAHLIAHGGYILERVKSAHEFKRRITNEDLNLYVKDYLDRYCRGFEFRELDKDPTIVLIKLPADTAAKFDDFIRKHRLHGQSRLASGDLIHCRFVNKLSSLKPREEQISQFHPLIRYISHELRERNETFFPLVAVCFDQNLLPGLDAGIYVFVAVRWTFAGLRIEEELHSRAIRLHSDLPMLDTNHSWELVNTARTMGGDWLSVGNEVDIEAVETAFDACSMKLDQDYRITRDDRINENSDRVTFQIESARRHCERLLGVQKELLARFHATGRQRLIPMTEGRIRATENKFSVQIEKLKQKAEMTASPGYVAYGVIRVDEPPKAP